MKVALVYDRVNKWGGAERVLMVLHEIFPEAPLYTSLYDSKNTEWVKAFSKIIPSYLNKLPFLRTKHELSGTLMPITFESFNFNKFDLVISVTSESAKGIITKSPTKHVCYCLTPTRYLWSHYHEYFKGYLLRGIAKPAVSYLRTWDKIAADRPDVIVAISTAVKDRIKKYYSRDADVIFPPVEIEKLKLGANTTSLRSDVVKGKKYFLVVSRLVPYKRVDLVIKVFNQLGLPLIIVGKGSEERKLKKLAKKNTTFTGFIAEEKLVEYYRGAKALIMPQEEDFGIVAVEAQAVGTPVIAYKKGGALDTVIEGKTGIYFDDQTFESLIDAVKRFARMKFKTIDLQKNAKKFSKEEFKKNLLNLINNLN